MADTNEEEKQPGTVQGSTTDIISNQKGADINHDGDDKKILKEGAEKETDEIDKIQLISFAEYNALSDEEKTKYVKYNPSLQSMAYAEWLALQNQAIAGVNSLGPAIDKLQALEKLAPMTENLTGQMKPIAEVFNSATNVISSLTSAPIIGQLAGPVFDAVLAIGQMCGYLYSMIINPVNMIKAYKDAYDSLDISKYKQLFGDSEETPNLETLMEEKQKEMSKIIIPDKEIQNLYDRQVNELKSQFGTVKKGIEETYNAGKETLDTVKTTMDTMDMVMGAFTIGTATASKKIFEIGYELAKEEYEKDYTEDAQKWADKINGFESKIPVKYIKSTDLDKIKSKQKTEDKPVEKPSVVYSSDNSSENEG